MLHAFTKNITRIVSLFPLALVLALLIPGVAMADSDSQPCVGAHLQIEQTQETLRASKLRQQQLQQDVRTTYQQLFACKTETLLSIAQQQHCSQLQEEGPKQFQAMVKAITLSHLTSQQLTNQTHQAILTCPASTEETFPKLSSLIRMQKNVMNQ